MEKRLVEAINEWKEFTISIKKMYKELETLEINGKKDTDEYKKMLDLIQFALEYQERKIDKVNINQNNFEELLDYLSKDIDYIYVDVLEQKSNRTENIRMFNEFEKVLIENQYFFTPFNTGGLLDIIQSKQHQVTMDQIGYDQYYINTTSWNLLYVLDKLINHCKNSELKSIYIGLKYKLLFFTLDLEYWFLKNRGAVLPLHDLNDYTYDSTCGLTKEDIQFRNRERIAFELIEGINDIQGIANEFMSEPIIENKLTYFFPITVGKLVSLNDIEFIEGVRDELTQTLYEDEIFSEINSFINSLFDYAKVIINQSRKEKSAKANTYKQKKKERKKEQVLN